MSNKNRKQWTITLDDEIEHKINSYKKLYGLHENKEVLSHMFENILNLEQSTLARVNKICTDYNTTKEELLKPIIERHINKTLKKQGIVKDKHKHSSKAESELLDILKNMVEEYKQKPLEERKFITASLVYRYLIVNNQRQKNMAVIKRVLSGLSDVDISFIKEYHQENNLSVSSNLKK